MSKIVKSFENERGYYEVNYLLRAAKVDTTLIGYQLLQTAIMSYLHDPSLKMEQLIEKAEQNSPMMVDKEQCFEEMKTALHNICTSHMEKLEDDNVVFKFIDNIASEIRIKRLIRIRIINEDLNADERIIENFSTVCIRRKMKKADSFAAILNHTAGKCGYEEVADLVNDLYKVVSSEEEKKQKQKKEEIKKLVEYLLAKKDKVVF